MKKLFLVIAEPWFSMIKAGEKKEEYREIKPYYQVRFTALESGLKSEGYRFKNFSELILRNGYQKNAKTLIKKNPKIKVGTGRKEWGAMPGVNYFVISWEN